MTWRHRVCASPADAKVVEHSPDDAQASCNFVVFAPEWLPGDCAVSRTTVRAEAPPGRGGEEEARPDWTQSNRAVLRMEIAGGGRALRIKQFFYDYAPPAFDHPCLWESPHVEPFAVGAHIGWLGLDFRKQQAASLIAERTTIELRVTDGRFSDDELQRIVRGLAPVSSDAHALVANTPTAWLAYQSRHREGAIAVPVGYWAHKRAESFAVEAIVCAESERPAVDDAALRARGYAPESRFVFRDDVREVEEDWVFGHADDAGRSARLLLSRVGERGGIPYPPAREERQKCSSEVYSVNGQAVHHAYAHPELGQHELVWQADGWTCMLLVKPGPWTTRAWLRELVAEIVR